MENNICEVLALFKSASFGLNFQLLRVFIACVIDFIYYEFLICSHSCSLLNFISGNGYCLVRKY